LTDFSVDKQKRDGRSSACKTCESKRKKSYYRSNSDRVFARTLAYHIRKRATDPQVRISDSLRSRINSIVKRGRAGSAVRDLGCTVTELKIHLESKFQPGMSWGNYGEWHIDHIKPLAKFDLTDRGQFLQACHFTNLQPLWAEQNLSKGARIFSSEISDAQAA
jgi:hypothetical protein